MENDFDVSPDTKPTITFGYVMDALEVCPFPVAPDFAEERTMELELCWQCGPRFFEDGDDRVREPRLKIFCECPNPDTVVEVIR